MAGRASKLRYDPLREIQSSVQAVLLTQKTIQDDISKMQSNQLELMKAHRLSHDLLTDLASKGAGMKATENGQQQAAGQAGTAIDDPSRDEDLKALKPYGYNFVADFGHSETRFISFSPSLHQVQAARSQISYELKQAFKPPEQESQEPPSKTTPRRTTTLNLRPPLGGSLSEDTRADIDMLTSDATEPDGPISHLKSVESKAIVLLPHLPTTDKARSNSKVKSIDLSYNVDTMAARLGRRADSGAVSTRCGHERSNVSTASSIRSRSHKRSDGDSLAARRKSRWKLLPEEWPASLTLREDLKEESADANDEGVTSAIVRGSARISGWSSTGKWQSGPNLPFWKHTCMVLSLHLALNPDSRLIICKELLGFLILLYDLIITPFIVSWDVEVNGFLLTLSWSAGLYWTFDCWLSFMTGYNKHGELIVRQPESMRHYVKRSFGLDAFLLIVDWINIFLSSFLAQELSQGGESLLRVAKMSRILKVLRLARLVRLVEKMSMYNLSQSTIHHLNLVSNMVKVTFFLLLFNHIMCCFWYMMGLGDGGDTDQTWLDLGFDTYSGYKKFRDVGATYQYLTALHWNIAQMTLGSSDVVPKNSYERIFNISLLVMGLLIGSTVVSLFSAQIVQFIIDKHDEAMLIDTLQRFLGQNAVPPNLRVRVISQVDERLREQGTLSEEDVPALQMLSTTLRLELMFQMRMPHVSTHPLFQMWCDMDFESVHRLCESAVTFTFLSTGDDLFLTGSNGNEAYYLTRGTLYYTHIPHGGDVADLRAMTLSEPVWFCEAALWTNWIHVGDMRATKVTTLMEVSVIGLYSVLDDHEAVRSMTLHYGRNYYVRVVSAVPPHAPHPDDIKVPFTDASDLLSHHVGMGLLKRADRLKTVHLSYEQRKDLEKELQAGKCAVQRKKGGNGLERIVAVVTVRIQNAVGRLFYQVAKWEQSKGIKYVCQLPGSKRSRGELPQAALDRIMGSELQCFRGLLTWRDPEHEVDAMISEQYNMPTTYMRTVHVASFTGQDRQIQLAVCGNSKSQEELEQYPYPVNHLSCREVYCLPAGSKAALYAWLHPLEVEALKNAQADLQGAVKEWLESLNLNEAIDATDLDKQNSTLISPTRTENIVQALASFASFTAIAEDSGADSAGGRCSPPEFPSGRRSPPDFEAAPRQGETLL